MAHWECGNNDPVALMIDSMYLCHAISHNDNVLSEKAWQTLNDVKSFPHNDIVCLCMTL